MEEEGQNSRLKRHPSKAQVYVTLQRVSPGISWPSDQQIIGLSCPWPSEQKTTDPSCTLDLQ